MSAGSSGTTGERWVKRNVRCPHCHSKLMLLPQGFPLVDVQCTRCLFRAQVKTNRCKPKDQIFGAGWEILDRSLRAGQLIPPLLVYFEWSAKNSGNCRRVIFYPFLTEDNIQRHKRPRSGRRPGYKQFNYIGLLQKTTPKVILYTSGRTAQCEKLKAPIPDAI